MSVEEKKPDKRKTDEKEVENQGTDQSSLKVSILKRLSSKKWMMILFFSLLLNGMGVWQIVRFAQRTTEPHDSEIALGEFYFISRDPQEEPIQEATFKLYVSLVPELESDARSRISRRRRRLDQDLQELFRQAHGEDFSDPTLAELKQHIQTKIDDTLQMKAVSEVIITDFSSVKNPDFESKDTPKKNDIDLTKLESRALEKKALEKDSDVLPEKSPKTLPTSAK